MNIERILKSIEPAIVDILKNGKQSGRGVLIPGNMILTAAHCISRKIGAKMTLDYYLEKIKTSKGEIIGSVETAELFSDICIIGEPDSQELYDEAIKYEEFTELTKPVKISNNRNLQKHEQAVYIFNRNRKWVKAKATYPSTVMSPFVMIEAELQILCGASGGPIVNEKGELVSIVSNFQQNIYNEKAYSGRGPDLPFALPLWIITRIKKKTDLINGNSIQLNRIRQDFIHHCNVPAK